MKQFKENISAWRDSESNWDIQDQAEELGFCVDAIRNLKYLGSDINMDVLISDDGSTRLLTIGGVDVSDKEIFI